MDNEHHTTLAQPGHAQVHVFRIQKRGPQGGRLTRYIAFDDGGRRWPGEYHTRNALNYQFAQAGVTKVATYRAVHRLPQVAVVVADLIADVGLNRREPLRFHDDECDHLVTADDWEEPCWWCGNCQTTVHTEDTRLLGEEVP